MTKRMFTRNTAKKRKATTNKGSNSSSRRPNRNEAEAELTLGLDDFISDLVNTYGIDEVNEALSVLEQMGPDDAGDGDDEEDTSEVLSMRASLDELLAEGIEVTLAELVSAIVETYGLDDTLAAIQALENAEASGEEAMGILSRAQNRINRQQRSQTRRGQDDAEQRRRHSLPPEPVPSQPRVTPAQGGSSGNHADIRSVVDRRYDSASWQALALLMQVRKDKGDPISSDLRTATLYKALKDSEKGKNPAFDDMPVVRALPTTRSDEIMQYDLAGYGDEWVQVGWSTDLWLKPRANLIWQELEARGARVEEVENIEALKMLIEGADPTAYSPPEAANSTNERPDVTVKSSKYGTESQLLTPGPIAVRTDFSYRLEETSAIPIMENTQRQLRTKMEHTIEKVIINGDATITANTNINLIDGTPGTGTSRPDYLAFNGLLKLALVTNTAMSRDAGATFNKDDFQAMLKLFPLAYRTRVNELMWLMDGSTELATLNIPELYTNDTARVGYVEDGRLKRVHGIDAFASGEIALANNAGKIPGVGGTLGRLGLVHCPSWAIGWQRDIMLETDRDIIAQATTVVLSVVMGLVYRATDAIAVSYNIPV